MFAKPVQASNSFVEAVKAAAFANGQTMAGSAELAMVDITTAQAPGGARQLFPPAARATVVKYPHTETELPVTLDPDTGLYSANATVTTGLYDTVVSDAVSISDTTPEWRTYYAVESEVNAFDELPQGYVTPGDAEVLDIPAQGSPGEVNMSFLARGQDSEGAEYEAYAKVSGGEVGLAADWSSAGAQSSRLTLDLSRPTNASEGLYVKFVGRTAGGVWEDILEYTGLQNTTQFEGSDTQQSGTWEEFRMLVGWTSLNAPLRILRAKIHPTTAYFTPFVLQVGQRTVAQWPDAFLERTPDVTNKIRWNALVAFIRIHGDADVAGVGQVAWSEGDDEVTASSYPDIARKARTYYDMSRSAPAHAFWLPTSDDFTFKPLGAKSDNALRVSVRVTDPNAIVRLVVRGVYEFHTNNPYEQPLPYPSRLLLPGEREMLLVHLSRFPNVGCNPKHLKALAGYISSFAKQHPHMAHASKDILKTLSSQAVQMIIMAAADAL